MFLGAFIKANPKNLFFSNCAAMAPQHMFFFLFGLLIAASSVHAAIYYPCSFAGEFIPDDSDCGAYYVCDGRNVGQYFHCDTGLEYSIETSNCVIDGRCDGAGVRPPISTTERPPYTGTAPPGIFCTYPGQTYPDPYRCNLFWYCDTTMIATPIDCGSLYYNVYTQTCDYPRNVDCTNGYRPPTTTGTHTISTTQTTSQPPTAPWQVQCSGVHDELIPDPYDCSVYWLCFEGQYPLYQDCQGGLYFNVDCGCCDYPVNVPCVGGVRPTPSPGTPTIPPWVYCGYPGEHIPDRYDCQVYYVCTENEDTSVLYPVYYKCTSNLEFNTITNTCDYPENVNCEYGTRPTQTPGTTSPIPTAPPCITCRYPGDIIPDCYDCTVFYICDGANVPQYRHCSAGLYYNDLYQNCAPTSTCAWTSPRPTITAAPPTTLPPYARCDYVGQMVADLSNCQMYYYCFDVTPPTIITHECCAPTLRFNDVTTLCDSPASVVCGARPNDPFNECNGL